MPNDMFTLKALADELAFNLVGGKIEKINQPEKDEVIFVVHKQKTHLLVVSVNANCPRIHITAEKKDNPYNAPSFLMLLRKKLLGAVIENIQLVGFDRIIKINFIGRNEMADEVSNSLYIELLGRYSNIIICDDNDNIIEALRHIYPENSLRCILPKIKYELPPNAKLSPLESERIADALLFQTDCELAKKVVSTVSGFSMPTCREFLTRLSYDYEQKNITEKDARIIASGISELYQISTTEKFEPCYVLGENNEDFYVYPYKHINQMYNSASTLNEAVRICSEIRDKKIRFQNESKQVATAIKNAIKKTEKALAIAKQKVLECKDYEKYRICGELITNYIYMIPKGAKTVDLLNYYDNTTVTIQLDPLLSAGQNAQAYYKKYSKAKRTEQIASQQVIDLSKKLEYLYSLKTCLDLCSDPKEIEGIKQEAIKSGLIEEKKGKADKLKKVKALPPKEYEFEGFTIYRGRNNIDNEAITFGIAKEGDIWLHVKDLHGSHVVIKANGRYIPNNVIQVAAEIAAYYSEGKQTFKVSVDYCDKKYVKKNPSGVKGAVIYTNFKTAYITPKAHIEKETNK